ncbi:hypothetical protein R1flu_019490 [Riccia fluitans]|uniref:Uncharacterized protein n=1 Tax=Riccia fluitans TaxID=41844 RepID=A0ABD1ZIS6_9MARC
MLRFLMIIMGAFLLTTLDMGAIVEASARGRFDMKSAIEHRPYMHTELATVEMRSGSSLSNENALSACGKEEFCRFQGATVSPSRRVLDDLPPSDPTPKPPHNKPGHG